MFKFQKRPLFVSKGKLLVQTSQSPHSRFSLASTRNQTPAARRRDPSLGSKVQDVGRVLFPSACEPEQLHIVASAKSGGMMAPTKGSRVLVVLVFRELRSVKELRSEERVDGQVIGVLSDHDLAFLTSLPGRLDGQAGQVKHINRHDMESFISVWVFAKVDANQCSTKKNNFLSPTDIHPPGHLPDANDIRLISFKEFLACQFDLQRQHRLELEMALLQMIKGSTAAASQIAELQEDVKRLEAELVEESDDVVFHKFVAKIDATLGFSRRQ
ncbi:hypothetical protein PAXINDRAFT_99858 [Paxillus involutus ATCC 200175]|uniref:Uncharacterized protein n=1 Tax=Paxillus involutus ATCC 200175 TaxID=664439 RepID=A0A0C9U6M4_PAXIN|nr:hypothetical protein PAXINDRAFT_99858 [Paxillus involutus ATCC 200175]